MFSIKYDVNLFIEYGFFKTVSKYPNGRFKTNLMRKKLRKSCTCKY